MHRFAVPLLLWAALLLSLFSFDIHIIFAYLRLPPVLCFSLHDIPSSYTFHILYTLWGLKLNKFCDFTPQNRTKIELPAR